MTTLGLPRLLCSLVVTGILAGCESNDRPAVSAAANVAPVVGIGSGASVAASSKPMEVRVTDANQRPIAGAVVHVTDGTTRSEAITGADGRAALDGAPTGEVTLSINADGFEPATFRTRLPGGVIGLSLQAVDAWAIGRAIVLGTRMVDRASDGSALTFSVDVSVVDGTSRPIETLASSDFEVVAIDCGWGGPRDCASNAAGEAPMSGGVFHPDGGAEQFGLQPPSARHPYLVGVLAELSYALNWSERGPALKSFFTTLGGNDAGSLATVQNVDGEPTLTVLGPFTRDGRAYFDAIDRLPLTADDRPAMLESIAESIRRAAEARSGEFASAEPTVLVLTSQSTTMAEVDAAVALARGLGVRVSTVHDYSYGLPEMAVRTGGFVTEIADRRQYGTIFGALDSLLSGSMPYYRMQFRIKGRPGTFIVGGNAKVHLKVHIPSPLPTIGTFVALDVAIP